MLKPLPQRLIYSDSSRYRALMKYQRAKGIVDTLRWTIGTRGQRSPLEEGLGD